MTFKHDFYNFDEATLVETATDRYYVTPNGIRLKSVTQIIGAAEDKTFLNAWVDRVGVLEAERVSGIARNRGKAIHKLVETYILNQDMPKNILPVNLQTFRQFKKELDAHLTLVNGIEKPLYSETLAVAGTADLIGHWNDIPSIIDHKTSRYEKMKDGITNYFIQETIYSILLEERSGKRHDHLVTIIGCDDSYDAIVFEENRKNYEKRALQIIHGRQ